ncbi:TlpA family protein disulfide reductase [Roseivivax isoporae]|uniref:Thioredoxin domain-containing protein n=1 Tax=Roseivivax isoporae LMG 25204 TaxID=1449351 RepID=X7F4P9_9RHOB|nr:TlpA disulfide reductase family protein [Roseivivax isoporae]ETX27041.1 hypothetical protein RISW2_16975 [Roseivivax isoporae LMG 25204]
MNTVSLGPLVLDGDRAAALVGIGLFLVAVEIADRVGGRRGTTAALGPHAWLLLAACIVAARAGFVAAHAESFAAAPRDALKVWQGGFSLAAGAVGGGVAALVLVRRSPRRALPLVASAALALGGTAAVSAALPDPRGALLPRVDATDLSGAPVEIGAAGGPLVLNLWAGWCPPCRREMPMMVAAAGMEDAPRFLFVNQGEDAGTVARFLASAGLPGRDVALDREARLMAALGAEGLPVTVFVDAAGRLHDTHTGEISRAALAAGMRRIVKDTE